MVGLPPTDNSISLVSKVMGAVNETISPVHATDAMARPMKEIRDRWNTEGSAKAREMHLDY